MSSVSDLRKGLIIKIESSIYEVTDYLHVNPGKGQVFVRTSLKDLETGATIKKNFKKGDNFEMLRLDEKRVQFLYKDGNNYYFMDLDNYQQYIIDKSRIEDALTFLKESMEVEFRIAEGRPLGLTLPNFVTLKVISTEPGIKGNTAQGGTKPATLETGTTIKVPLFIEEGDEVVIDTRTGKYSERK
ncbi:elongation factor P [candidate division WOR-3 bacterium]|nr:elongation factor P [candidate division WOR-3 bacterium]MCK4528666.1 elongation factor P [candidate division WOR-3 bacterium]